MIAPRRSGTLRAEAGQGARCPGLAEAGQGLRSGQFASDPHPVLPLSLTRAHTFAEPGFSSQGVRTLKVDMFWILDCLDAVQVWWLVVRREAPSSPRGSASHQPSEWDQIAFFSSLGLHWSSPESGDLRNTSGASKETVWSRSEG